MSKLITFYFVLGLSLYPDVKIAVRNVSITPKINKSFMRIAPIHIYLYHFYYIEFSINLGNKLYKSLCMISF